ncbi:iron-containing alcohol dehydrogenase [Emcibacter nanhaiensis]|uniref:Alcohol dehydrogenase 2 n=1 Tax=Emcibacter nanhaiensis TaxID=1505037 RepID=A0A501PTU1_9PROT|nr:iron-containing alcohol dehydrogenase [Emcibacter nanhaiensis]TPD63206.1 iron-containing alcohol dehydrogenase [Emcibacter nanhaiensis]
MTGFDFISVNSVLTEDGAASRLGTLLKERFAAKKVMVVTDAGLVRAGLLEDVLKSLENESIAANVFSGVLADPSENVVDAAVEEARTQDADVIVGFGGGSSMDVAKLVAILSPGEQKLQDIYGIGNVKSRALKLVQIPTTAGTGSEVTPISIITAAGDVKMGVVDPHLLADLAILDATLTLGLPSHITAATGIDAMVHAIEAYTSAVKKNPISDALAIGALKLLGGNIVEACTNGGNLDARRAMLLGAQMAGTAFTNAPVAGVHALAYPLGGRFHIPHGLSNSLVLPHMLRFNAPVASALYSELAQSLDLDGQSDSARTEAFIEWLEKIADTVGIERRLRELNIGQEHLDMLAEDAMLQTRLLVNNPRKVTLEDARKIYQAAW